MISLHEAPRVVNFIETENNMIVTKVGGRAKWRNIVLWV